MLNLVIPGQMALVYVGGPTKNCEPLGSTLLPALEIHQWVTVLTLVAPGQMVLVYLEGPQKFRSTGPHPT